MYRISFGNEPMTHARTVFIDGTDCAVVNGVFMVTKCNKCVFAIPQTQLNFAVTCTQAQKTEYEKHINDATKENEKRKQERERIAEREKARELKLKAKEEKQLEREKRKQERALAKEQARLEKEQQENTNG